MNTKAMHKLSYGLFVITGKKDGKDTGCIVNTVSQVTTSPNRISVTVNKSNYTHDVIKSTHAFNVSILTENAPFEVFQRFGFQSGKDTNKFSGFHYTSRSGNGLLYLTSYTNAFLSCWVTNMIDLGTHTMFIAEVTDCEVIGDAPSVTYGYYQSNIKPKPQKPAAAEQKKGYRCTVCGYVYEGETLSADFVCPLCKHGADDFEPI
ncbi:MAG: flavin reductase [Lachnospiraceae bacterium]|nr:flavin reductase [Lachnospiraceae bacterium]